MGARINLPSLRIGIGHGNYYLQIEIYHGEYGLKLPPQRYE